MTTKRVSYSREQGGDGGSALTWVAVILIFFQYILNLFSNLTIPPADLTVVQSQVG